MKSRLLGILFALVTVAHAATSQPGAYPQELKPAPQQTQAALLAAEVLTRYHYKAVPLDDAMSGKIFDLYLKALDSEKLFFVQSDIDQLVPLRTRLDNAIVERDLAAPFFIFNRYMQRAAERFTHARALLQDGFDFAQKETYQYDREKERWPQSETEVRDLWRKRVKNDWLRLKLAGKDDKSIVETLGRRYDNSRKRIGRISSDDAFQIFMNAYTMAIEPHTNYMGPRAAEDFDISMRLSMVGIGAVLAEKNDYTTIRELVPGGPAALSGQLHVGDRIVGVAQGRDGTMTDVQGSRLDDTVALIRGALDSTVVLHVLPANAGPDGKHQRVSLVRKKITLEEQAAKKSILTTTDGEVARRIGVISLPSFYDDFEARQNGNSDFKSATRDVVRLLSELKDEKVDAVLIDLRNNGGGSLAEAIELTGLFVGKGPVLQQRDARGNVKVLNNTRRGIAWDGPLGVLINRSSASASEIFAAAIQDYGRGWVIGEPSFGKGTVQTMFSLDQLVRNEKPQLGELKFTIAQFFRINGGTTQLRGVTPDFMFPTLADADDLGESSFDNALPWMQVRAADYSPSDDLIPLKTNLLVRNEARQKSDRNFLCLQEVIADYALQRKKNQVTLNEADRRQELIVQEVRAASCEVRKESARNSRQKSAPGKSRSPRDDGLQTNERNLATELAEEKDRKEAKDVLLDKAVHILGDSIGLVQSPAGLALQSRTNSQSNPN